MEIQYIYRNKLRIDENLDVSVAIVNIYKKHPVIITGDNRFCPISLKRGDLVDRRFPSLFFKRIHLTDFFSVYEREEMEKIVCAAKAGNVSAQLVLQEAKEDEEDNFILGRVVEMIRKHNPLLKPSYGWDSDHTRHYLDSDGLSHKIVVWLVMKSYVEYHKELDHSVGLIDTLKESVTYLNTTTIRRPMTQK